MCPAYDATCLRVNNGCNVREAAAVLALIMLLGLMGCDDGAPGDSSAVIAAENESRADGVVAGNLLRLLYADDKFSSHRQVAGLPR
jgi:hypothetical protein